MTDLVNRLAAARPSDEDLLKDWRADEQDALLDRIRDAAEPARDGRRLTWLAVAAALAAVAVVPPVIGGGDASAQAEILALAAVAAEADGPLIAPGTHLHVKTESVQENSWFTQGGATFDTNREAWIGWDGTGWAIDTRPSVGWIEHHRFERGGEEASFGSPTPEFIASLPDAPDEFRTYLDENVSGSDSHDEALFTAVKDMAWSHMLTPATFAVALEAIADIGRVRTEDVTIDGREAVEISFRPYWVGAIAVESFTVDKETAQVLRAASSDPGGTYESTTTLLEVVDQVPPEVPAAVQRYGDGGRICADGTEADGDGAC